MQSILILSAHPDLAASRANKALLEAARALPGVAVHDLHAAYPDGRIDAAGEARRLLDGGDLVLQFPLQWYSVPSLLKDWLDAVLTRMFYLEPEAEGSRLRGRKLTVAVTVGAPAQAYSAEGRNGATMAELLRPLEAVAHRCGLQWQPPFVVYDARDASDAQLEEEARRYAARLGLYTV
jgi:putative NADPH-quinone reductase